MSELLIGTNPDKPQIVGMYDTEASNAEKAKQLPVSYTHLTLPTKA